MLLILMNGQTSTYLAAVHLPCLLKSKGRLRSGAITQDR